MKTTHYRQSHERKLPSAIDIDVGV